MTGKCLCTLLVCVVLGLGTACSKPTPVQATFKEKPIPAAAPTPVPESASVKPKWRPNPAPTADEVRAAVKRIFGDTVSIPADPMFIAGDFNGDWSIDLAVVGRTSSKQVAALNSEVANWIIADPTHPYLPPAHARVAKLPDQKVQKVTGGEEVVAVIHGHGELGWRNPAAMQAYLLRHVAGEKLSLKAVGAYDLPRTAVIHHSQAIAENVHGHDGLLYWSGSNYAWKALN